MKKLFILVFCMAIVGYGGRPVFAQENNEAKLTDIRRLVQLENGGDVGSQALDQFIDSLKMQIENVPEEFWQSVRTKLDTSKLEDALVAVYDKYFTHKEIQDLLAFYETETGRKFLEVLPEYSQESLEAGQQWASEMTQYIGEELKQKGYIKE